MKLSRWHDKVVDYPGDFAARYAAEGLWRGHTIAGELHAVAVRQPDAPALADGDTILSWRELDEKTDLVAAGFITAGLRPGDPVLLQLENRLETVLIWYGLIKAAAIPVATLSVHRGHELRQIARIVKPRGHIVAADVSKFDFVTHAQALDGASARVMFAVGGAPDDGRYVCFEDLGRDVFPDRARALVERAQAAIGPRDVAVFQLSGGTTGTPKVIPRLHCEYWYNSVAYAARQGWDQSVVVTHLGPVVHNAGIVCALHAAHACGGTFVIGTPAAAQLLPQMVRHRVTDLVLFPTMVPELRTHPDFDAAFTHVRRVTFSVSSVSEELYGFFDARGICVLGLFGMGEGLCLTTAPDAPARVRRESVGHELSQLDEARVLAPGTEDAIPPGQVGELCCRGPYTIRGYLDDPERNAVAFTSDGFYRTGDLVAERVLDGVRCFTFEGRTKDLINRGGEKVSTSEIEALVLELPGVEHAALVAVPDQRLGERGCLVVQLNEERSDLALVDVQEHFERREVARYKWPEFVMVVETMPMTAVGKTNKVQLRILVAGQFETAAG
jgi:2,3-dihydroxybenzoate-AMP ligase